MFFVPPCALHLYQDLQIKKGAIASSGDHIAAHERVDFEEVCIREYGEKPVLALRLCHKSSPRYVLVEAIDRELESFCRYWEDLYGSDNHRAHMGVLEKIKVHVRANYIRGALRLVS